MGNLLFLLQIMLADEHLLIFYCADTSLSLTLYPAFFSICIASLKNIFLNKDIIGIEC